MSCVALAVWVANDFTSAAVSYTHLDVYKRQVSAFDCRLVATHDVASHRIVVGEVAGLGGAGRGAGLIYRLSLIHI